MFQNLIEKAYAQNNSVIVGGPAIAPDALLQNIISNIVNPAITLMVAIAILYFLWGVFGFIRNADNPEERKKGGLNMMWGVFGIFIMASAYGVVHLIKGTLGLP